MQFEHGSRKGIDHQRDDPCGIRFQRQPPHRQHQVKLLEEQLLVANVVRWLLISYRFRAQFPLASCMQSLFDFSDGCEVLVES